MTSDFFLIFDCDGVLVDSEWLVARIEVETRAEFGQQISIEEYIRRYVGLSTRSPEYLESLNGLPPEFRDIMRVRVERAFHEELEAIPGVADLLERIRHRPKAIASSSSPHEIEMMLEHVGLLHHFELHAAARAAATPLLTSGRDVCRYQSHVCDGDGTDSGQRRSQLTAPFIRSLLPARLMRITPAYCSHGARRAFLALSGGLTTGSAWGLVGASIDPATLGCV